MESDPKTESKPQSQQPTDVPVDEQTMNPEVQAWFEKFKTEEEALKQPADEKKKFILNYYSEDVNSDLLLEQMLEEAEKVLDQEIQAGHNKPPFSENIIMAIMAISKGKVIDELLEEVSRLYQERRKLVKGKEINDPGVINLTQINCSKLAFMMHSRILKQVEEEAKSRDLQMDQFMYLCGLVASNDMQTFVEIERLYNHRKTEENKDKPFDLVKVKEYIKESLKISGQIISGELESTVVFLYPHLLSDKLYNLTGFESEEVVHYIRKMVKDDTIDDELVDLVVQEAYSVEKSRENCQTTFDTQMMNYERRLQEDYIMRVQQQTQLANDPLEDRAIKSMIQTGMLSREDAQNMINKRSAMQGQHQNR